MNNEKELIELVKPICKWIEQNADCHTQVVVTIDDMKVTQDVMGVPINKTDNAFINIQIDAEKIFKTVQQVNENFVKRHNIVSPLSTIGQALTEALIEENNATILSDEIHRIVLDFDKNDFRIDGVRLGKGCTKLDISYGCFDWNIGVCVDEKEENNKYVRRYGLPGISKKI